MKMNLKKLVAFAMAGMLLFTAAACAPDEGNKTTTASTAGTTAASTTASGLSGKIIASGSTSMEELMLALGEAFTAVNPDVSVEIQGGGSSTGVKNAVDGVTDIGNASRALKDEEKNSELNEYIVAYDGIAVVVNAANQVTGLTAQQIADIYTGKITNWKDVGGADAPIVVVVRDAGSGTRDGFEEILGIKDQTVETQTANETGIVKSTVAGNVNAIGYMSLGKVDATVHALLVDGVLPTEATVKDKSYQLQRPFLCLTKGDESELVKAFMDFILGSDGQTMVAQKGFVKVG